MRVGRCFIYTSVYSIITHPKLILPMIHRRRTQNPPQPTRQTTTNSLSNHLSPPHTVSVSFRTARTPKTIGTLVQTSRVLARSCCRWTIASLPKRESIPTERSGRTSSEVEHADGSLFSSPRARASHLTALLAQQELRLLVG